MTVRNMLAKRIEKQGDLIKVHAIKDGISVPCGAKRGNISQFTAESRKRMLEMFARIDRDKVDAKINTVKFITLTYKKNMRDAVRAKRDLKVLQQRIFREFPDAAIVWRMEYQKRGAIHFHLMLFNVRYWNIQDAQYAWNEVAGQDAANSLDFEAIKTLNGVMRYVSKYMAKTDSQEEQTPQKASNSVTVQRYKEIMAWEHVKCTGMIDVNENGEKLVPMIALRTVDTTTGELVDSVDVARNAGLVDLTVSHIRPRTENDEISTWTGRFWGVAGRKNMPFGELHELFTVMLPNSWKWCIAMINSEFCSVEGSFTLMTGNSEKFYKMIETMAGRWFNLDCLWDWRNKRLEKLNEVTKNAEYWTEKLRRVEDIVHNLRVNRELAHAGTGQSDGVAYVPAHEMTP